LKKHPNIWTFIQNENVRLEHSIIPLSAGASSSKPTAFQRRFQTRFEHGDMEAKQLLNGLALLLGSNKKAELKCINFTFSSSVLFR
jgi:hypothetical protein